MSFPRRLALRWAGAVALVAAVAAGCSGDKTEAGVKLLDNQVCALLPVADVERVIGGALRGDPEEGTNEGPACSWVQQSNDRIVLAAPVPDDIKADNGEEAFDNALKLQRNAGAAIGEVVREALVEVGAEAVLFEHPQQRTLIWRVDANVFMLASKALNDAQMVELATIAATNFAAL